MKRGFNINVVFYYISFLLLLVAIISIISLFQLGGAIDIILKENLPSAIAGEKMSESLTRMQLLILGNPESFQQNHGEEISQLMSDFTVYLTNAKNNITIRGEDDIIYELDRSYSHFRKLIDLTRHQKLSPETRNALLDSYQQNIRLINQLISINNSAIITADENAKSLARNRSIWMIFLAIIGFISVFYLIRLIRNKFSTPISEMLLTLRRVHFGDQNIRLKKRDGDLGDMAEYINNILDSMKQEQSTALSYAFEQRDILSAIGEMFVRPFFVFDLGKHLIVSNESGRSLLQTDTDNQLEMILRELVTQEKTDKITLRDKKYIPTVSVLRDKSFNKLAYSILLTES